MSIRNRVIVQAFGAALMLVAVACLIVAIICLYKVAVVQASFTLGQTCGAGMFFLIALCVGACGVFLWET